MSFTDLSASFGSGALLTWQNMDQLADNDDFLKTYAPEDVPAFAAYLAANQSVNSGAATKLVIDTEEFDNTSAFNAAQGKFTPLVAGKYFFTGRTVMVSPTTDDLLSIMLYKNGALVRQGQEMHCVTSSVPGVQVMAAASANGTTDYFELYVSHDHGSARDFLGGQKSTYFSGFMLFSRT